MYVRALPRLMVVCAALVILVAACSADEIPTYEPQESGSPPASEAIPQSTTTGADPAQQSEQTATTEPAGDDEEAPSLEQTSQSGETEAAQPQVVAEDELYVPVINAHGSVSPAITYTTRYDAGSESVWTEVSSHALVEGAVGGRLSLELTCWQAGYLSLSVRGFPVNEARATTVRFRIDDGPDMTERWEFEKHFVDGVPIDSGVRTVRPVVLYEQLSHASRLTIEVVDSSIPETAFDLAGMFETPVEGNLQHCGRYAPGQTRPVIGEYAPLIDLEGRSEPGVRWEVLSYSDGSFSSRVAIPAKADGADMGVLELVIGCAWWGPTVEVVGLPGGDGELVTASLRLDDGAPATGSWYAYLHDSVSRTTRIEPIFLFYELMRAKSVMLDFGELGIESATLDLTDAFTTPIQQNLERCGQYHPTERREWERTHLPLERVGGELGPATRYWAGLDERRQVDSRVTITPAQPDPEEPPVQLIVGCLDEWQPVVKLTGLPETKLDGVSVDIRFGDTGPVSAVWEIESSADGSEASSPRAELLQYLLRDLTTLGIEIPELEVGPIQFDLTYLFKTPIQANLAHCGQYS